MLIYDRDELRIYATEIPPLPEGIPGARSVAERAAVKRLLREAFPEGGVGVGHRASGAPYLERRGGSEEEAEGLPDISISHCRRLAVMALAPRGEGIGVDCESGNRAGQLRRVARKFLSAGQLEGWSGSDASLFWAWTIKEAAYKAAQDPSLTMAGIPLPAEIPVGEATADSEIEIGGRRYGVFQADSPDAGVIIMVVRGI